MSLSVSLKFGTEKHDKLVARIRDMVRMARNSLSTVYTNMKDSEDQFYAYVEPANDESSAKNPKDDFNRPGYKTIYVPYSYAIAQTMHTYVSSVFMSRDPIFQVEGRHGETQNKEMAMEAFLDYQVTAGKARPVMFNWFMDAIRSGMGVVGAYWCEDYKTIAKIADVSGPLTKLMPNLFKSKSQMIEETLLTFEGTKMYPVRGLDWFYDTRFAAAEFQKGEFCGELGLLPMARYEAGVRDGSFIKENLEIVKNIQAANGQNGRESGSTNAAEDKELLSDSQAATLFAYVEKGTRKHVLGVYEFYWELIPAEWGLSKSENVQKWYFCVAEDSVIIAARPYEAYHGMFPYGGLFAEIDFYKKAPRSLLAIMQPMETTINWLVNQHFYNVRKHLNNHAIIDPSLIVLKDLYQANPGGYIRKRPEAYGRDVSTMAYQQIQNTDITRANLSDVRMIEEFTQRFMGVNDNTMGMVNPGGRKTAQEIRTSSSYATNRIKTLAEWFSATGVSDLCQMMVQNSQQYYTSEKQFKIAGDLAQDQATYTMVSPESIAGFYDFAQVDGTMPIDRFAVSNLMREMFMQLVQSPQMAGQYRVMDMFEYISQLAGARNIKRFRVQVMPNEQIQQQAQAGNVVPISQAGQGREAQASVLPGMGAA